jgi:thioredoxin 1
MSKFNNQIAGDGPVLVEFFATWCPHCRRMMPVMEELEQRWGAKLKVVQLDVDNPANHAAMHYFGVTGTPTFVLFKHDKPVWEGGGEMSLEQLTEVIDEHLR